MKRKSVAIVFILVTVIAMMTSFFVPHYVQVYNSPVSMESSAALLENYSGPMITETFLVKNIFGGELSISSLIFVTAPNFLSNLTGDNYTLLNEYGPDFTLESSVAPMTYESGVNGTVNVYGGWHGGGKAVKVTFVASYPHFGFGLYIPPIKLSGGDLVLELMLLVDTGFLNQGQNYSSVHWGVTMSNVTFSERVYGIFNHEPAVTLTNTSFHYE